MEISRQYTAFFAIKPASLGLIGTRMPSPAMLVSFQTHSVLKK